MDPQLSDFITHFASLAKLAEQSLPQASGRRLRPAVAEYLSIDPSTLSVVTESFGPHRLADANNVIDGLLAAATDVQLLGLSGNSRHHSDLSELLTQGYEQGLLGEPGYVLLPIGPGEHQRFVSLGVFLFTLGGHPTVLLLRQANPQYGRSAATLEIVCADGTTIDRFLSGFREGLRSSSIFRGQVISFSNDEYSASVAGVSFHPRPQVTADQVILPEGTLERISTQVTSIGDRREVLLRHGAHLKRGVLLYGPPGTGKTHTVRHLVSEATDHTVVLLSGNTLQFISEAARMARALQPAVVVLEDCDLIAEDRSFGHGPQPLLFEVLDAMDGLDSDADVVFLLTTNRVESLERALVQRPGRIDLAVEIPRPDLAGRRKLLELYGSKIRLDSKTLDEVAGTIEGTTASLARELIRRSVLLAALQDATPTGHHLRVAAGELMDDSAALTRSFLGGTSDPESETDTDEDGGSYFGYVEGYRPGIATSPGFGVSEFQSIDDFDSEQDETSGSRD
ncbi:MULTISPECIES: ATP-binding protein [unclassified Glutamicibacter]|uniref:ATP-binding protein n=1 Tax=unclassified Glutamicibacter TaxID=2627139 RepID=UPI000FAA31A8